MERTALDREAFSIETLDVDRRQEILSAYLDGELSPQASRHVTTWLDAHPEALRETEHLRRLWDVLALYEDEPVRDGFASRVLDEAGAARAPSHGARRVGLWAAAASVLLAGGLALWSSRTTTSVPPEEPGLEVARVLDDVPPDLLEDVDVLLSLSDEEFEGLLLADLETP